MRRKIQNTSLYVLSALLIILQVSSTVYSQNEPIIVFDEKNMVMVLVPSGEFTMGATVDEAVEYCESIHEIGTPSTCSREMYETLSLVTEKRQVRVSAFYMDRYEVSRLSYIECIAADVCDRQSLDEALYLTYADLPDIDIPLDLPMTGVSYTDAAVYCAWRQGRLPTEAEWEYAAAGSQQNIYSWGNDIETVPANCSDSSCAKIPSINVENGFAGLASVDSYEDGQSWAGIYNLSGNASELTSTRYYPSSNLIRDEMRILKGGSWRLPLERLANWMREPTGVDATSIRDDQGFRCVRTTDPTNPPNDG